MHFATLGSARFVRRARRWRRRRGRRLSSVVGPLPRARYRARRLTHHRASYLRLAGADQGSRSGPRHDGRRRDRSTRHPSHGRRRGLPWPPGGGDLLGRELVEAAGRRGAENLRGALQHRLLNSFSEHDLFRKPVTTFRDHAYSAGCSAAASSESSSGSPRSRSTAQPTATELSNASNRPRCFNPICIALIPIGSSVGISAGSSQAGGAFLAASSFSSRSFSACRAASLRALLCAISSTMTAIAATTMKNAAI